MANNTEDVERILRFNCPEGCDGKGSYPEMGADGEWEQGQCQWCFEYGMPAREAIQQEANRQKLELLELLIYHYNNTTKSGETMQSLKKELEAERNKLNNPDGDVK